jgi:starvation-inducible outer membrane lipoprotein
MPSLFRNLPKTKLILLMLCVAAANCARQELARFRAPFPDNPTLAQVSGHSADFLGQKVRWGGLIVHVAASPDGIALEIAERLLDSEGRPTLSDKINGRFIIKMANKQKALAGSLWRDSTIIGTIQEDEVRSNLQHKSEMPPAPPIPSSGWHRLLTLCLLQRTRTTG